MGMAPRLGGEVKKSLVQVTFGRSSSGYGALPETSKQSYHTAALAKAHDKKEDIAIQIEDLRQDIQVHRQHEQDYRAKRGDFVCTMDICNRKELHMRLEPTLPNSKSHHILKLALSCAPWFTVSALF